MSPPELFRMWIGDRQRALLDAADLAERAYQSGPLRSMCAVYAERLRAAAAALGPDELPESFAPVKPARVLFEEL